MNISATYCTLTEAATSLGVERHTIWRWIKIGKIKAQKAGGVVFIERTVVERLKSEHFARSYFDAQLRPAYNLWPGGMGRLSLHTHFPVVEETSGVPYPVHRPLAAREFEFVDR